MRAIPSACDENWVYIQGQRLAHSPVDFKFLICGRLTNSLREVENPVKINTCGLL